MEKEIKKVDLYSFIRNHNSDEILNILKDYDLRDDENNNILKYLNYCLSNIRYLDNDLLNKEKENFNKKLAKLVNVEHLNKFGNLSILENKDLNLLYINDLNFNLLYQYPNKKDEYPVVDYFLNNIKNKYLYKINMFYGEQQLTLLSKISANDKLFKEKYIPQCDILFNAEYVCHGLEVRKKLLELGYTETKDEHSAYKYVKEIEEVKLLLKYKFDINKINKEKNENILFDIIGDHKYDLFEYVLNEMSETAINHLNNEGKTFISSLKNTYNMSEILNTIKKCPKVNMDLIGKDLLNDFDLQDYKKLIDENIIKINDENFNEIRGVKYPPYFDDDTYIKFYKEGLVNYLNKNAHSEFTDFLNKRLFKTKNIYKNSEAFQKGYELLTLDKTEKIKLLNENIPIDNNISTKVASFIGKLNNEYDGGYLFITDIIKKLTENNQKNKNISDIISKTALANISKNLSIEVFKNNPIIFDVFMKGDNISNMLLKNIIKKDEKYFKEFFKKQENYEKYIYPLYNQVLNKHSFVSLLDIKNPFEQLISLKEEDNFLKTNKLEKLKRFDRMFSDYIEQNTNEKDFELYINIDHQWSKPDDRIIDHINFLEPKDANKIKYGLTLFDLLILKIEIEQNSFVFREEDKKIINKKYNSAIIQLIKKGYMFNKNEVDIMKEYEYIDKPIKCLIEQSFISNNTNSILKNIKNENQLKNEKFDIKRINL